MFSGTTRQILAGMSASLAAFSTGQTFSWSSPILDDLLSPESPIPMTRDQSSWVVTSMEFGCLIIPFVAGWLADKIGRKLTLLITGPFYAFSWILAIYTRDVLGLYIVRMIQGLCVATIYIVCPMFLGEISETHIRGAIGTLFQISTYTGILYTYVLGSHLSYRNYQIANLFISLLFMCTFIFVPESPCFFIKKNKEEKAQESLKWFRHGKEEKTINEEYVSMKEAIQSETEKGNIKTIARNWTNVKSILLIQGIIIFRTFTHVQTIMAYASTTFGSGEQFIPSNYISILFSIILLLSIFPATYLVDKAGRKILLLISTLGCGVFSFVSFVYYFYHEHLQVSLPTYFSYLNFGAVCCLGIFYSLGLGPLYSPLTCEYFPSNTRALSSAIISFSATIAQLVGYKVFYLLHIWFGMYSNFLLSSAFCVTGTIWIHAYIIETKGKTFAEIQALFAESSKKKEDKVRGGGGMVAIGGGDVSATGSDLTIQTFCDSNGTYKLKGDENV